MNRFGLQLRGKQDSKPSSGANEKIVHLPNPRLAMEKSEGGEAIDLIYQAAEFIRRLEVSASEVEQRARAAMEEAATKLQNAECFIKALQADRLEMEQRLDDTSRRAKEAEGALRETQNRLAATEAELSAMEMRVNASEARALKAKQALTRVEDAIRTHLLNSRYVEHEHPPIAAA